MTKFEIRNKVRDAVKTMFEHSLERTEVSIYNITLKFDYCDDERGNLSESWVDVKKDVYGKASTLKTFYVQEYAGNDWNLVAEPWVCDFINDITDLVMKHIETPKQRGW